MEEYKCIKSYTNQEIGIIYNLKDCPPWFKNYESIEDFINKSPLWGRYFEEVIKPKKWSVGTYVVFIKEYGGYPVETIDTIKKSNFSYNIVQTSLPFNGDSSDPCNLTKNEECKWFATKSEAEAFAKELLTPKTFKLGQYDVTIGSDIVKVGCSYLHRNEVIKLLDSFIYISEKFDDNSFIEINGLRVTLSTAYKLRDYINEH